MDKLLVRLKSAFHIRRLYFRILSSIAFLPSVLALGLLALSFFILYLDTKGHTYTITGYIPFILTDDQETARTLLGTLVAGMISLMVFSFSMVMVVLTMASNNYSPRVLPGLVNTRSHQAVLGVYLGTIGYLVVVLINIGTTTYEFKTPDLSILFCVILVFCCFVCFVYFIHTISQSIQIANILSAIYKKTLKALEREKQHEFIESLPGMSGWQTIPSPEGAYFQGVSNDTLIELAQEEDLQIVLLIEEGDFIIKDEPLMMVSKPMATSKVEQLQQQANFYHQEHIDTNYLFGFKHITEVAVKALSPGINDPGTALNALDYLTQLFCLIIEVPKFKVLRDKKGFGRLIYKQVSFEQVFYLCFSSIRNYAASDVAVQLKLLKMLRVLQERDRANLYTELFEREQRAMLKNATEVLRNTHDQQMLEAAAVTGARGAN